MIGIRPYNREDAKTVISWCDDEKTFYRWTAGRLGNYSELRKNFKFAEKLMAFVAFDETEIFGFFTLRFPVESENQLRFGFVIINPEKRGRGYCKQMLTLGLKFAFEVYGVKAVTIGVFENNPSAYYCYKSLGFCDYEPEKSEIYDILGEKWKCVDLIFEKK